MRTPKWWTAVGGCAVMMAFGAFAQSGPALAGEGGYQHGAQDKAQGSTKTQGGGADMRGQQRGTGEMGVQQGAGYKASAASEMSGKVKGVKEARRKGSADTNTIVLLETADGRSLLVDLGPTMSLKDVEVKTGLPITVSGTLVTVDGKPVFMANQLKVGDATGKRAGAKGGMHGAQQASSKMGKSAKETAKESAKSQQEQAKQARFTGRITQIKDVSVADNQRQHKVAVIETNNGRRLYVDLGPRAGVNPLKLEKGDQVRIKGVGRRESGRAILMAQEINANGRTIQVDNGRNRQQGG